MTTYKTTSRQKIILRTKQNILKLVIPHKRYLRHNHQNVPKTYSSRLSMSNLQQVIPATKEPYKRLKSDFTQVKKSFTITVIANLDGTIHKIEQHAGAWDDFII